MSSNVSINKYFYWAMIGVASLGTASISDAFVNPKDEMLKKELLKDAKPLTEIVIENRIDMNGNIVEYQRFDTVAYEIKADKLKP